MTPHVQLNRHDPSNGVYGDCFRTCIASMLDLAPAEVPHVFDKHHNDGDAAFTEMGRWLGKRGLRLLWVAYDGSTSLRDLLATIGKMNPGLPFMLGGQSRPGVGHFVVCMDGEIVSDPSRAPTGQLSPHDDGLWHGYFMASDLSSEAPSPQSEPKASAGNSGLDEPPPPALPYSAASRP